MSLQVTGALLLRGTLGRATFPLLDAGPISKCGDRFTLSLTSLSLSWYVGIFVRLVWLTLAEKISLLRKLPKHRLNSAPHSCRTVWLLSLCECVFSVALMPLSVSLFPPPIPLDYCHYFSQLGISMNMDVVNGLKSGWCKTEEICGATSNRSVYAEDRKALLPAKPGHCCRNSRNLWA